MPAINTAQEAVEAADRFLRKYHGFLKLEKVVKQQGAWLVEFDVAILGKEVKRVRLDAESGQVTEFTPV